MKIINRGGTRAVHGLGLVNAGDTLDVTDEVGERIVKIPGFAIVSDEVDVMGEPEETKTPQKKAPKKSTKSGGKKR